jgi:hypothetical protein
VGFRYVHIDRHSRLVVNEISHKEVVVPEGAVGVHFDFRSSLKIEFSFTLNYNAPQFGMI